MKIDWNNAYSVERDLAEILAKQEQHGWLFNLRKANWLVHTLKEQEINLSNEILPNLPPVLVKENPLNIIFLKSGGYRSYVLDWLKSTNYSTSWLSGGRILSGPFTRVHWQEPSLTSQDQVKKALSSLGWEPDEWNYKKEGKQLLRDKNGELIKTSPKITESSLKSITGDSHWGKALVQLLKVQARLKFFGSRLEGKGLLSHIRPDSTVPSETIQCGTNTGRVQHLKVANVPAIRSFMGMETRSLFIARPNCVIVGVDYSQLETRIIAHAIYLYTKYKYGKGDERFLEIILGTSDVHTYLWDDLRDLVSSRDLVKNINYAFPYGAQAPKLGSLCDIKPEGMSNKKAGERVLEVMEDKFPGLVETRDATIEQAKANWLLGLDGRKIYVRSPHSAFNAKIQGWGSEVVKKGIVLANHAIWEKEIPSTQVGYYHDEIQVEAKEDVAEETKSLIIEKFKESGTFYNLSCPMEADGKIGHTWADTH